MSDRVYSITDLSKMIKVKVTTIRKYEKDFDLMIPRNEMGHRYYTDKEITVYKQIKAMKEKGATTQLIRNMLNKSIDAIEQKEQAIHLVTLDKLTGLEFKDIVLEQIAVAMSQREEQIKQDFEKLLDEKLERHEEQIRKQIASENQRLIDYIKTQRDKKRGFWNKFF